MKLEPDFRLVSLEPPTSEGVAGVLQCSVECLREGRRLVMIPQRLPTKLETASEQSS